MQKQKSNFVKQSAFKQRVLWIAGFLATFYCVTLLLTALHHHDIDVSKNEIDSDCQVCLSVNHSKDTLKSSNLEFSINFKTEKTLLIIQDFLSLDSSFSYLSRAPPLS